MMEIILSIVVGTSHFESVAILLPEQLLFDKSSFPSMRKSYFTHTLHASSGRIESNKYIIK